MLIYILFWNIIFTSLAFTGSSSLISEHNSTKTVVPVKETPKKQLTLITEGGTIVTETPTVNSSKANHSALLSLDSEYRIEKQKPIHPRKSAIFNASEEVIDPPKQVAKVQQLQNLTANASESTLKVKQHISSSTAKLSLEVKNKTEVLDGSSKTDVIVNAVTEHMKPTILSYDVLSAMDAAPNKGASKIPDTKSSTNTMVDQMPSPNEASGLKLRSHLLSTSKNPGMIMPIVITILVVPAFAVLAYMALKRGREAWKNRHYKRMDFLLDGMYND